LSSQKGKEPPGLSVTVLLHKERSYIADYLDLLDIYAIGHDSKISDLNVCFMDTVLSTSLRVRARVSYSTAVSRDIISLSLSVS
jgi:hypothetical protein